MRNRLDWDNLLNFPIMFLRFFSIVFPVILLKYISPLERVVFVSGRDLLFFISIIFGLFAFDKFENKVEDLLGSCSLAGGDYCLEVLNGVFLNLGIYFNEGLEIGWFEYGIATGVITLDDEISNLKVKIHW